MNKVTEKITIENARIGFRNFKGEKSAYNPNGDRSFSVFLDPELAERLAADGWNVKYLQPREEGDDPIPHLPVAVRFDNLPPIAMLITRNNKTRLDETSIDILDWAEIQTVDLMIQPYNWGPLASGACGVKAYLKSIYVTVVEDELAEKYADIPE